MVNNQREEEKYKDSINMISEEEKTPEVKKIENNTEWTVVSPGKASRSPNSRQKDLEFGQISILTKSRFSVLTPVDEGDYMKMKMIKKSSKKEGVHLRRRKKM